MRRVAGGEQGHAALCPGGLSAGAWPGAEGRGLNVTRTEPEDSPGGMNGRASKTTHRKLVQVAVPWPW